MYSRTPVTRTLNRREAKNSLSCEEFELTCRVTFSEVILIKGNEI